MGNATSHELPSTRRLRKRMAPAFSCEPDYKTKFIRKNKPNPYLSGRN